jgi:GTPase
LKHTFALVALLLCLSPIFSTSVVAGESFSIQQNPLQLVIDSPTNNRQVADELLVKVEVRTIYELTAVTARIAGQEYLLPSKSCMTTRNNQCVFGYESKISTSNLAYGNYRY